MEKRFFLSTRPGSLLLGAAVLAGLYLARRHSYLLFHTLAETFSVAVACAVFMVAWNARRSLDNGYFLFVGIAYLSAATVDILHMLSYKGMGVFPGRDANLPTQLWVAARYLQGVSLLLAPWFAGRNLNHRAALACYAAIVALLLASIFSWNVFPDCFVEGTGLTAFKIYSEYAICALLLASIPFLWTRKRFFDADVLRLLVLSTAVAVLSELSFTLYKSDVYGAFNLLGHSLKILSFFLVYRAIIGTDLVRKYDRMVQELRRSEQEIRKAKERLEGEVAERTAQLREANERLAAELAERRRAEEEVRAAKERLEVRVAERTAELSALADRLQEELSRRRTTERTLAASEERFRTLVEDSPVGICIVQDGRIVFQNPEQRRLFGPVPDGLEFAKFRDVHPDDSGAFARLAEAIRDGKVGNAELDLRFFPYGRAAEGTDMRWARVRTSPIEYLGKRAVLFSMSDVTRAKEMEQLARVREKMSSLGHVAAGIAHEIRNPLSGINIYVSTMEHLCTRSEGLKPEEREKIGAIVSQLHSASRKIASVIRRVMDFAKPNPPRLGPARVNEAVEEAIQLSAVSLRKQGIELSTSLSPDLPPCLADLRLIEQVILNLINNAAQAMEGIDAPKRIEIGSCAENGRILLRVSDSGPGIPPSLREKIFDPFFTTRKEGYGIGLSFSHRVITDHEGALTVGTSGWGGAEFRIELPLATQELSV